MKKPVIASLLALSFPCASVRAEIPILPFDQVETGMRGTGRTVFQGTRVESFDIEILGKLPNIGPDQDLILARCSGGPLAETRVLSGMSGSPVTIDGKLIGAVAYSWGFSTDAIAGITPIGEMLRLTTLPERSEGRRAAALPLRPGLGRLEDPQVVSGSLEASWSRLLRRDGPFPVTVPLAVSGLGTAGLARVLPRLAQVGLVPMQAGGSGSARSVAPPLEPGSAIGLQLVHGDIEMTATGTVTWVDGDQVLAFGHPLFGLGAIDLPMTGARVETLLPSLRQSARVAIPLDGIGALRQDRAAGVLGRRNAIPRTIPVRVQLERPGQTEQTFSFGIADDPALSPLLLYVSVQGILASKERAFGSSTIRLRPGSVIKMVDTEDVELDNLFAGPTAFDYGTGLSAYILHLLMNNAWSHPQIAGVNLIVEYRDSPRIARIRRSTLDRYRVRPGETAQVTVVVRPYRGSEQVVTSSLRIPDDTPPGPLTVHVGSALAMSRAEQQDEPVMPRDLEQLIRLINQLRRNDQVYIVATREDPELILSGTRLPNLPPSAAAILSRPGARGEVTEIPRRRVAEDVLATEHAVTGSIRLQLDVERR